MANDSRETRVRIEPTVKKLPKLQDGDTPDEQPRNLRADVFPTEGYVLAIDGKFKSSYATLAEAMKAGTDLKGKFPVIHVAVYDTKEKTRTPINSPATE